ncbi:restriction endonuclease subunit S [Mesorhizobium sp. M0187]|uniref:restriction endonuclease subunit S n=1 Tax=Mesorhizobium sp. M0187 TaxID=2956908 RepID=UPI00333A2C4D
MAGEAGATQTGGRPATGGTIKGRYGLSVGNPGTPLPDGWTWTALSSVARLETGHTPSRKHPEWWGGEIPWIGIRDATSNHGRIIYGTREYTNQLGIENSSARILPANTVCLSRTASVGYVVVMGVPMATSQDFLNWVCSARLNHHFLKYVLLAEKDAILQYASGTTHQTIYFPEAKAFHIALPPVREQNIIANLLNSLDDKIERNRRMAATLQEIAQALFKSWFVDFDPVHAKVDRRILSLPAATLALFPDRFGENGLPEGWRESAFGDVFDIRNGNTPSTEELRYWGGEHQWATPKDLSPLVSPVLLNTDRTLSDQGVAVVNSGLLPPGSVLLSTRAPIGYIAFATRPVAINQGMAGIVGKEISTAHAWLWCIANNDVFLSVAGGSTFPEISKGTLRRLPMVVPSDDVSRSFSASVDPIVERLIALAEENDNLALLRDSLLPRLISGELRIKDIEAQGEAA